jgi:BlaI family transcriptional regulator, penicillinase repressor
MPRRPSPALTDGELRIMRVLWESTEATVGEVVDRLNSGNKPAYNTVLTMLKILERKGYVAHKKDGRAFRYAPVIGRSQAQQTAVSHLISRFFNGSSAALVLDLLGPDRVSDEERRLVRELLDRAPNTPFADASRVAPRPVGRKER